MKTPALQIFLLVLLTLLGAVAVVSRFFLHGAPVEKTLSVQPSPAPKRIASAETKMIQKSVLQATTGFDVEKFKSYGFPVPEDPNPSALGGETLNRWNQYIKAYVAKASSATGVDPGIIGMWTYLEGEFVPFDNCDKEHNVSSAGDSDHNTQCYLWGDNWQVGLGLHPAYTIDFLTEAFDTMYGSHDNATVQKVGQDVIANLKSRYGITLTIVSSFPNASLESIIQGSKNGDFNSRNLLTTLMKDEALGTYLIARHFKDNVGINNNLANTMKGWSSTYYAPQKIINYIKAIYDAGVSGGTTPGGGGGNFGTIPPLKLVVRPKDPDSWVVNQAFARVLGARGGTNPNQPGSTTPGKYGFPLKGGVDAVSIINTEMATYPNEPNCMEGVCHMEHAGLDLMTDPGGGGDVVAIEAGTVTVVGGTAEDCATIGWGCRVEIQHSDGITSAYVHTEPIVTQGQQVKRGEKIATVHKWTDSSWDHLHFELKDSQGHNINPRNTFPELNRFPPITGQDKGGYYPTVREHTARLGYPWVDDGKESGETYKNHPPCPAPMNNDSDCWAH